MEKWLENLYGEAYVEYCREVNRAIPFPGSVKNLYETKISDARWIFYDILGDAGWILYTVALILIVVKRPEYLENPFVGNLVIAGFLPVAFIVMAIGELISERILKLDRVLSQKRLFRGFGSLVVAAILGLLVSAPVWLVAISWLQTVLVWEITISEKKGKLSIFPAFLFCLMNHIIRSALSYQKRGIYIMHFPVLIDCSL